MPVFKLEINLKKKEIKLSKVLSGLDKFVLDFCSLLDDYVVVSDYVSILFGRSRSTEDVNLLVPEMSYEKFEVLWKRLKSNGFDCINVADPKEAFGMLKDHAIRFCMKGNPIPNIEFKTIKKDFDKYSFINRIKAIIGGHFLFISPIEMQIAFKLFLAADGAEEELRADKDIEDARYLYSLFGEKINKESS